MGSFPKPGSLPLPISAAAVVLVRGITDDPERRNTRRQSVRGVAQDARAPARPDPQAADPVPKADRCRHGVTVTRKSQIEHGEVTSFEVIACYVKALGGRLNLIAALRRQDHPTARTGRGR